MTTRVPTSAGSGASRRPPIGCPRRTTTTAMATRTSSPWPTTPPSIPLWLWAIRFGLSLATSPQCLAVAGVARTSTIATDTPTTMAIHITAIPTMVTRTTIPSGVGTRPTMASTTPTTTTTTAGMGLTTHTTIGPHTTNPVTVATYLLTTNQAVAQANLVADTTQTWLVAPRMAPVVP